MALPSLRPGYDDDNVVEHAQFDKPHLVGRTVARVGAMKVEPCENLGCPGDVQPSFLKDFPSLLRIVLELHPVPPTALAITCNNVIQRRGEGHVLREDSCIYSNQSQ